MSDRVRNEIVGDAVFTVDQFLTADECSELVKVAEGIGFEAATVNARGGPQMIPDWRNNTRVILDDSARAAWLWELAREFVPDTIAGCQAVGVNERLRFYRYDPGQKFDWHTDGYFRRDNGEQSRLTFMVYLNGGMTGGETSFSDDSVRPRFSDFSIMPETGQALFFAHMLLHKGQPVTEGRKYVLRTDLMYSPAQDP